MTTAQFTRYISTSATRLISTSATSRVRSTLVFAMKDKNGKTVQKANLPSKVCITCNRPFTWRKAWEKCWGEVKYCSDRCRTDGKRAARSGTKGGDVATAAPAAPLAADGGPGAAAADGGAKR